MTRPVPNGRTPRSAGALAATLTLLTMLTMTLAACADSGGGGTADPTTTQAASPELSFDDFITATRASGAAIYRGSVSGPGAGPIEGGYSKDGRGVELVFPAALGADGITVEVRRVGARAFVKRSEASDADIIAAGLSAVVLQQPGQPPWVQIKPNILVEVLGPLDVASALETARDFGFKLRSSGTADGPIEVAAPGAPINARPSTSLTPFAIRPTDSVRFWTDANGSVSRWERAVGDRTFTVEITHGDAVAVTAPPRDEIFVGDGPAAPKGDFTEVVAGNSAGLAWSVQRALGTQNSQCWRVETTPPITSGYGNEPYCVAPPTPEEIAEGNVDLWNELPFFAVAGSPFEIVVFLTAPGVVESARVDLVQAGATESRRDAGRRKPIFDRESGVIVYAGPPTRVVRNIVLTDAIGEHDCSPWVYEVDPGILDPDETMNYRQRVPWSCLETFG